jgi:formylglycine-generating enzyme required for sulfatase activity
MTVTRNPGAKWFIASENEWYKAAYYQPAAQGGDSDNYWNYPMRTNGVPFSDQPPGATPDNSRVGNFFKTDNVANGYDDGYAVTSPMSCSQGCFTDVGAYSSSPSYYGTFDQGGNIWEWTESLVPGMSFHVHRGGSFRDAVMYLQPFHRFYNGVTAPPIGFRVATIVPEPSAAALLFIGSFAVILGRCRLLHYRALRDDKAS